jgi:hypothetical protein
MVARYYNSSISRLLSVDPTRDSVSVVVPNTWNRYSYVVNRPVAYLDPTGKVYTKFDRGFGDALGRLYSSGSPTASLVVTQFDLNPLRVSGRVDAGSKFKVVDAPGRSGSPPTIWKFDGSLPSKSEVEFYGGTGVSPILGEQRDLVGVSPGKEVVVYAGSKEHSSLRDLPTAEYVDRVVLHETVHFNAETSSEACSTSAETAYAADRPRNGGVYSAFTGVSSLGSWSRIAGDYAILQIGGGATRMGAAPTIYVDGIEQGR